MTDKTLALTINGVSHMATPRAGASVLGFVRDTLGLMGAKVGCQTGDCGACTMVVDGIAVQTCQVPLSSADGADVTTVEALADDPLGARVTAALIDAGAAQCGYCLPGIVASATAALRRDGVTTDIGAALSGNICRCGTQHRILRALAHVRDGLEGAP